MIYLSPKGADYLQRVRDLGPMIDAYGDKIDETRDLPAPLAACRTRDFRSITTAVRLRRRGHETAGVAPITS